MRHLLVGVVGLLMLGGSAFGATGFSITGPATVAAPGDPIEITINLTSADIPLGSWDAYLNAAPALTVEDSTGKMFGQYYVASSAWDVSGAVGVPLWGANTALPIHLGTLADITTGVANLGPMFRANLFAAAPGTYTVDLEQVTFADVDGTQIEDQGFTVAPLVVQVLPEPVSALLLLAGLPMLRRRR